MTHRSGKISMFMNKTGDAAHRKVDANGFVLPVDFVCEVIEESDDGRLL